MEMALAAPAATIVDNRTGGAVSIDASAFSALKAFLRAIGAGYEDERVQDDVSLTTGQAAEIVGTSSRTIARMIDSCVLPGTRSAGGHRHVMLSDLMEFERMSKAERPGRLEEMRQIADEEGFYDDGTAVADYLGSFE